MTLGGDDLISSLDHSIHFLRAECERQIERPPHVRHVEPKLLRVAYRARFVQPELRMPPIHAFRSALVEGKLHERWTRIVLSRAATRTSRSVEVCEPPREQPWNKSGWRRDAEVACLDERCPWVVATGHRSLREAPRDLAAKLLRSDLSDDAIR